jgi:phage terminase Nu1 subunit (DNA packaging protein)
MGRLGVSNTGYPRMMVTDDGKLLFCTERLTEFYEVDPKTITNWVKKGCPREKSGWYDLKAVNNWLQSTDGQGDEDINVARKLKADIMFREERVAKAVIERKAAEGLYLPKDEVYNEFAQRILEIKSGLDALENVVSSEFTDANVRDQVRRVLHYEFRRFLEQYSREGTYTPHNDWESELVEEGETSV